jgi:hypothetical protein
MVYHDTDGRRLLARERAGLLASEMRRVRRLTAQQAGFPGLVRLAAELRRPVKRMRRRRNHASPAYEA